LTIQHGLPQELLYPSGIEPSYVAFLGRICPEKRPDRAIRIARSAGQHLRLAAKVDQADAEYFSTEIAPMLGNDAALIGEINDAAKSDFLSGAKVFLMPIDWPEPFGLVMIEAMACGTPVRGRRGPCANSHLRPETNPRSVRGTIHCPPYGTGLYRYLRNPHRAAGKTPASCPVIARCAHLLRRGKGVRRCGPAVLQGVHFLGNCSVQCNTGRLETCSRASV
jgi:hypothetical protein